jgi:pantoate--beta-alanine ligase
LKIISNVEELRREIKALKAEKQGYIGLVPTMGALHKGHLSLIETCRAENEIVIVSVFVNPTQFGPNEDYDKYPRTIEADSKLCEKAGVDFLFAPSPKDIYSEYYFKNKETTLICPPYEVVNKLCGKSRPGHFDGVCTIVAKLFNITKCDRAYFGKKDAQQLFIIKNMVRDLNFDIDIIGCPIIREEDNLAMSSRNTYLNDEARSAALNISKALFKVKELREKGINESATLIDTALTIMQNLEVEYTEIVSLETFENIDIIDEKALMLIAAKVNVNGSKVRLIDNIEL